VALVGDERVAPGPDTGRRGPGPEAATEESHIGGGPFLLKTPAGVLAAQRLAGNQALQQLLSATTSTKATSSGGGTGGVTVAVSRDAGSATAPSPDGAGQAISPNPGDAAQPLGGSPGSVTYSYSEKQLVGWQLPVHRPRLQHLDGHLDCPHGSRGDRPLLPEPDAHAEWHQHPQDGSNVPVPDDAAPVSTGTFTVVDSITLPTWTNVGSPAVQDAQRTEWNRYTTAVAAHEDLHASDDKATYDPVGAPWAR